MRVPHDSLVLVADGRKRLMFRNEGDAAALQLAVIDAAEDVNPATSDQVTDAPGRGAAPSGATIALARADAHQIEEDRFAAETADIVCNHVEDGRCTGLIVVAPAKTLGEIRKHYKQPLKSKLIGELAKDLTGHPVDQIEKALLAHEA